MKKIVKIIIPRTRTVLTNHAVPISNKTSSLLSTPLDCPNMKNALQFRNFKSAVYKMPYSSGILSLQCIKLTIVTIHGGYYMPACGYEFYLLVFNSISHEFAALTREI